MSNRPTLNQIPNGLIEMAISRGWAWNWYVLKDRAGHIRDWVVATNAEYARKRFGYCRKNGILKGYRVERRGKVGE